MPLNENILAERLMQVLKDDKLAKNMGLSGRQLIINKYSWSKVIDSLEETYLELGIGEV